ncbi:hypothetical protein MOQ_007376, partial [Trypanosoma cruzi marinkellei]
MMSRRLLCFLFLTALMCCFSCATAAATGVHVRPGGDGAVTAGNMWAVTAAESEPVADGSELKGNVNSDDNSNQEAKKGGRNTAGAGPNPTSAGPLTAPTRQDQSSGDPLRSSTVNPSGSGSASAAEMRASGPQSLGGGHAAGTTSPLSDLSQQTAGGVHAGGGRTSQSSQASEQNVKEHSQVPGTAKETLQGDEEGEPGAQPEVGETTKDGGDSALVKNGNETGEPPAETQSAPPPSSGRNDNAAPNPAVSIPQPPKPKSTSEATGTVNHHFRPIIHRHKVQGP